MARLLSVALTLPILVSTLSGCAMLRTADIFTTEDEVALGLEFDQEISKEVEYLNDPVVQAYITDVTQKLAKVCQRPDIAYQAKVVLDEEINAFAVPGGYLYVNIGLIRAATSESELIGVMGHEIGHVVASHGTKHLTQQYGLAVVVSLITGKDPGLLKEIVGGILAVGGQVALLKNSREDELEADALGVQNLYDAGYDPEGLATFFETLLGESGDPDKFSQVLSTHPATSERIAQARGLIADLPPKSGLQQNSAQFQEIKKRLPPPRAPNKKDGGS
ncbi:MAG: M48 family metallopeptidase [Candidatus Poribacteria bacterium]|nr:M48 family metallopeptidase [Candidatus Poribacteria bacterium]